MATIRWGMIGCGDVAEVKSGPGFMKARDSTLVAVMRRDATKAADYARRHGVPRWHDDADAIVNAPDIDAVYISTLTDTHCDYTLRCAAAGKPVYVEKPMGMHHRECVAMIDACRAARVPLWVGYYRRMLPRFIAVRELIEEGAIGVPRIVVSRLLQRMPALAPGEVPWRVDPDRSGGGFFFEGVCHTFDFLDYLFGPIESVQGFAANQAGAWRSEDLVTASWRFVSGVYGSGAWCYSADVDEEWTEVVGTAGRLRFSISKAVPILLSRGERSEERAVADPPHVHQPMIQSIVDELNGRGHCPSTGESAARTAWVMESVLADLRRHAPVVG